jgi:hypothetical protein
MDKIEFEINGNKCWYDKEADTRHREYMAFTEYWLFKYGFLNPPKWTEEDFNKWKDERTKR